MGVLWVLVILLILFALIGGVAVNNWLFLILLIALILLLVGAF
jgi:hypothetical protein